MEFDLSKSFMEDLSQNQDMMKSVAVSPLDLQMKGSVKIDLI